MNKEKLRQLVTRIDAMSLRERVLIFASTLVVMALCWFQFAMEPVVETERRTLENIRSARERIAMADAAVQAQTATLAQNESTSLSVQLDQAHRRSSEINALIAKRASRLVDPATMAEVLEDLIVGQRGLQLLRARNLEAQVLGDPDSDLTLYRHTLRLELEGPYLAVLQYLEGVEALPWRLYWQGIDIDATDYPSNRVRIDVSTLSLDEDWIGV